MSEIIPIFRGTIQRGKIVIDNHDAFAAFIAQLEGKRIEIVVSEAHTRRSTGQNRYYHGVVVKMVADHIGDHPDVIHEFFKNRFLREIGNDEAVKVGSTSKLNPKEFAEYVEKCRHFAAEELHVDTPDPSQVEVKG